MAIKEISVIIPSFHSCELNSICIRSLNKFKPEKIELKYIVVENSEDKLCESNFLSSQNIMWINNKSSGSLIGGSRANAEALTIALKYINSEWILMCHNDVCANFGFFENMIQKIDEGYRVVGTVLDPARINAIHISGLMVSSDIANSVNLYPQYVNGVQIMDVGDSLTDFCRKNCIKHYCFPNTFSDNSLSTTLDAPYNNFVVDRCVSNKKVIWMHLGRGTLKTLGLYNKKNKKSLSEWVSFCVENVIKDS